MFVRGIFKKKENIFSNNRKICQGKLRKGTVCRKTEMLPQAGAERVSTAAAAAAGTVTKRREGEEKKDLTLRENT